MNDYLARRDAEWVGQPLRFLGMTVGIVQNGMAPDQKKKAYRSDVTYVTNSRSPTDRKADVVTLRRARLRLPAGSDGSFTIGVGIAGEVTL